MDGWIDRWMDGRTDGWMDGLTTRILSQLQIIYISLASNEIG